MKLQLRNRRKAILLLANLLLASIAADGYAFSAISLVPGKSAQSLWSSFNFPSQQGADKASIAGCKKEAAKNGIGNQAKKCKIVLRGKGPGYGAVTCGTNGCAYVTGHESSQEAVDAAFASCRENYSECVSDDIRYWEDNAGFNQNVSRTGNCRPRTASIRCQSSCSNGDCIVSYENGCKMRVQVQPQFDAFKNQWIFPSPSC